MHDPDVLVSVIIPYYNRPEKLERCIASILKQTYNNVEIIVVDDASKTPPKVFHNGIKYLKNKINSGPGTSRNYGMQNASGLYIAFLDCDDYWAPTFLKKNGYLTW